MNREDGRIAMHDVETPVQGLVGTEEMSLVTRSGWMAVNEDDVKRSLVDLRCM